MRKCFFCPKSANSLEDVWPHWITDQFKSSKPCKAQLERHRVNVWHVRQPELKVRFICQSCNSGWMSALESQTKNYLQPLLMGGNGILDIPGQTTISLWSLKTAMVLEALDTPQQRFYCQQEREYLMSLSAIPWRTSVWLAKSVDWSLFLSTKNRHMGESSNNISGASITIVLAHIAIQVLTIRVPPSVGPSTTVTTNVRRGPWDRATVQIWPPKSTRSCWPPTIGLNSEDGLNAFAERFSTAKLDASAVDSLTV